MSRPIKVSDELYERLRDQAKEQELTLQDALVELIAQPHEGLTRLESELGKHRTSASAATEARKMMARELERLGADLARLSERVDQLFEVRARDTETWNRWVEVWNQIRPLESRVAALEKLGHQHFWQETNS